MISWPLRLMRRYGRVVADSILRVLRKLSKTVLAGLDLIPTDQLLGEILKRLRSVDWARLLRQAAGSAILAAALAGATGELRRLQIRHSGGFALGGLVQSIMSAWGYIVDGLQRAVIRAARSITPLITVRRLFRSEVLERRAVRIAEQATHSAVEGGREQARLVLITEGYTLEKEWVSRRDDRVRDTHEDADGQRVPLRAFFRVGGYLAQYPGDPRLPLSETANCRCITETVVVSRPQLRPLALEAV